MVALGHYVFEKRFKLFRHLQSKHKMIVSVKDLDAFKRLKKDDQVDNSDVKAELPEFVEPTIKVEENVSPHQTLDPLSAETETDHLANMGELTVKVEPVE